MTKIEGADNEEMKEQLAKSVIEVGGLNKDSDIKELKRAIDIFFDENADDVSEHKKQRERSINFLMGQIMKASKGQVAPAKAKAILRERLTELEDSAMKKRLTELKTKEDIMMNQDSESHKDSNEIPIKKTRTKPKKEDSTMKEDYIRGLGKSWNWVTDDYRYWHNCLCVGKVNHLEPGPSGKCEVLFLASGMWGLDEKPKRTIVDREGNGFSWIHEQWSRAEHKRLGKKYVQQAYSHIIEKKRKAIKSTSVPTTTTTKKKETNDEK